MDPFKVRRTWVDPLVVLISKAYSDKWSVPVMQITPFGWGISWGLGSYIFIIVVYIGLFTSYIKPLPGHVPHFLFWLRYCYATFENP